MMRIRVPLAMVLLCTVFVLFLYNLNIDASKGRPALRQHLPSNSDPSYNGSDAKAKASKTIRLVPRPLVYNLSVSADFRRAFLNNGAYWSRLLHASLEEQELNSSSIPEVKWSHCREATQELLQTNVHDFSTYPDMHKDFLQGLNCRSPPQVVDQPQKCIPDEEGTARTFLLLAIKSLPSHFEQRQAIRETWGKEGMYQGGLRVRTVFLLGRASLEDPDLQLLLLFEAQIFKDVIQWDFHESLFNLTLKMHASLKWMLKSCPDASFILSGDDDVFVNTPAILGYLRSLESTKASTVYMGQVISNAGPHRDHRNKYYIPWSFYDAGYPAYAGGGGYLISGALLRPLLHAFSLIPLFPIDDVYIGMCMNATGISPQEHSGFRTFDVRVYDRENMCVHRELMLIHQRTPHEIKRLWKGIHNPLLKC